MRRILFEIFYLVAAAIVGLAVVLGLHAAGQDDDR
jgi:hypothetical protein